MGKEEIRIPEGNAEGGKGLTRLLPGLVLYCCCYLLSPPLLVSCNGEEAVALIGAAAAAAQRRPTRNYSLLQSSGVAARVLRSMRHWCGS